MTFRAYSVEYRVVWKRVGLPRKTKRYAQRWRAERLVLLLGPEPWKAIGKDPDAKFCCSGYECDCRGRTVRDEMLGRRTVVVPDDAAKEWKDAPYAAVEYVRIEEREVGLWKPAAPKPAEATATPQE